MSLSVKTFETPSTKTANEFPFGEVMLFGCDFVTFAIS
jgi:hypothetical protein